MSALLRTVVAGVLVSPACFTPLTHAQPASSRIQLVREQVLDGEREDFPVVNGGHANARLDIALTLRQDAQVRVYDAIGRRVATIGRKGQAPGEFLTPQVQGWIADTVWVYDFSLRRHSFFTRDGRLIRSVPVDGTRREVRVTNDVPSARIVDFSPTARRDDGTLVGSATLIRDGGAGSRLRAQVLSTSSPTGVARKLASIEQDGRWAPEVALTVFFAVSPNGREAIVTSVSDLTVNGSDIIVSRFDTLGTVTSTSRIPYRGVAYPTDLREQAIKRGIGLDNAQSLAASRIPSVLPPVYYALVRDDGVAMLTMQHGPDSLRALILDARGVVRGELPLPKRASVIATRGTWVWLRERNSDDVASVVRYRMMCGGRECFPK